MYHHPQTHFFRSWQALSNGILRNQINYQNLKFNPILGSGSALKGSRKTLIIDKMSQNKLNVIIK